MWKFAQFQGDERHIMFLSMIDSGKEHGLGPIMKKGEGAFESTKKRYNVAASRAQDQLWVVHSLDPNNDLKPEDLRRELILHAQNPMSTMRLFKQEEPRTESEFERQVLRILINKGYKVRSQWSVGYYRIDMVVEGDGKRLAVECDGDRWHPIEKLADDMARQAILERLGWTFTRIRGSAFFRDEEQAMRPVFGRLDELGIAPGLRDDGSAEDDSLIKELEASIVESYKDDKNDVGKAAACNVPAFSAHPSQQQTITVPRIPVITKISRDGELRVKVGDLVRYVDLDQPDQEKSFRIVSDGHNPTAGLINEGKPIAQSLLGAVEGNVIEIPIMNRAAKRLRLIKIERAVPLAPTGSELPGSGTALQRNEIDLVQFCQQHGLEMRDKRSQGGALWVHHNSQGDDIAIQLKRIGFRWARVNKAYWRK